MWTSIVREFLAPARIALFAPRPMLDHKQNFLQISAARMLLCSSLVQKDQQRLHIVIRQVAKKKPLNQIPVGASWGGILLNRSRSRATVMRGTVKVVPGGGQAIRLDT